MARHYASCPRKLLEFTGHDLNQIVARLLGGRINDGLGDGGKDVIIHGIGGVQVKCSPCNLMNFLGESLRRGKFIAVIVGEPGKPAEMMDSLLQFGAWFGSDIHDREELLRGVAEVRDAILKSNQKRLEVK